MTNSMKNNHEWGKNVKQELSHQVKCISLVFPRYHLVIINDLSFADKFTFYIMLHLRR